MPQPDGRNDGDEHFLAMGFDAAAECFVRWAELQRARAGAPPTFNDCAAIARDIAQRAHDRLATLAGERRLRAATTAIEGALCILMELCNTRRRITPDLLIGFGPRSRN